MPNLNSVMLMGNMTRDPEVKYLPSGMAIADVSIAVNRTWKSESGEKKEEVTFVGCTAFGRTAEVIAEYFKKGNPIFIQGRLKQESWDDKTTGKKQTKTKVVIESFEFIGGDKKSGAQPQDAAPVRQTPPRAPQSVPRPPADPALDADSSDVPF